MILLVEPDTAVRARLTDALGRPGAVIGSESSSSARATLEEGASGIRVVVIGPSIAEDEAFALVDRLDRAGAAVECIVIRPDLDSRTLRAALRAGARDVLPSDVGASELRDAVARAEEHAGPAPAVAGQKATSGGGRLITVFSTKGGSGKSVIAANLAILLGKRTGTRGALVDLNLQSGDQAIMLQLMPALSIYEATQNVDRLDAEAIEGYLTPHQGGVSLLAAPVEPSLAEQITPAAVGTILDLLLEAHPHVVVDGPSFFTDSLLTAVDRTDLLVLVGSLDVPSVKNLRLALNTLSQLGFPRERMKLVLNRSDSRVGLRISEVEKSIGAKIDVEIPTTRDVPLSVNQGSPLALGRTRSAVVSAIEELVPAALGEQVELRPESAVGAKRGRFGFGFGS